MQVLLHTAAILASPALAIQHLQAGALYIFSHGSGEPCGRNSPPHRLVGQALAFDDRSGIVTG